MDIDTTSINDLPINPNNVAPTNNNDVIDQLNVTTNNIVNDKNVIYDNLTQEKKVRFNDELVTPEFVNKNLQENKNKSEHEKFVFNNEHKVIIISVFLFFIFFDSKFKKYILNILVQIFGNFLKNETGSISTIGTFFYALTYGLVLYTCVSFIDLSSFYLSF